MLEKIEYRVRMVPRYFVTRYAQSDIENGSTTRGEYESADVAYEVAYALCRAEHDRLGWKPDDERIQYPRPYEMDRAERAKLVAA